MECWGGKYDAVEKKGHHTIHFKEKKTL